MKKEEARLSVRLHPETSRKLTYIAEYYGRSVNREIDWLVKQEIKAFETEHGKIELADLEENK